MAAPGRDRPGADRKGRARAVPDRRSEKRVTIYDIAAALDISTATVNRALTGKPRVKEETRQLVLKTAAEMGFKPNSLARSLARRRLRFAVVGFTSFPEFHDAFLRGALFAGEELADFNTAVDCFEYDRGASDTPEALEFLEDTLHHIGDEGYDGALVLGRPTQGFEYMRQKGVYVATAVTDVGEDLRRFHMCYRARVAGRIAAELIYRMLPDRRRPVVTASGFEGLNVHADTEAGFREQLAQMPLNLARVCYNHDNESRAYDATMQILREYPRLGAIYVNSFNYRGVIAAVRECDRIGDVLLITSDVSDELKRLIEEGVIVASIFQNQYEQGRMGLHKLYDALANGEDVSGTIAIDPQIVMRSNLTIF